MKIRGQKNMVNRAKVVDSAARMYREFGLDGIGIRLLSNAAGLTHGSFYAKFPGGKNQLMSEALTVMFEEYCQILSQTASINDLINLYLSASHCQNVHHCCPIPVLSGDASRHKAGLDDSYDQGVRRLLEIVGTKATQSGDVLPRKQAMHVLSSIVGAMLIARALQDEALAEEFLSATRQVLTSR